ncbi:MAG TPA: carboxypeptidase-like regulatory domain-containing protein [Acidobacteriota bacterium]|nr:carboxypeptidase-like regulatory domain-containing protein [Acidobacteriota bacterium]
MISGKIYQSDKKTVVTSGEVRVINVATGESQSGTIDKEGCYAIKELAPGNYSVAVNTDNADYMLPDKVIIQNKVTVASCLALSENNGLAPLDQCKVCKKGFPPIGFILIGLAGTAGAVAIVKHNTGGEEPTPASPSQP